MTCFRAANSVKEELGQACEESLLLRTPLCLSLRSASVAVDLMRMAPHLPKCPLQTPKNRPPPPPPPFVQETPLYSKRGGEETLTFTFPNLQKRFDIELLPLVCWLDKVGAFVHCCVLHISSIQGTVLDPV